MDAGNLTSSINLSTLKYASLQELAKKCGLKANQKAEKLRDSLRIHLTATSSSPATKPEQMNENDKETKLVANRFDSNGKPRRIRRRTFELDEAAMGALTPEILAENKAHEQKKLNESVKPALHKNSSRDPDPNPNPNPNTNPNPVQIKWKLIDEENKPPVAVAKSEKGGIASTSSSIRKRVALRPQRILRKTTQEQSKIPRPARVATDAAISKKSTPNFARIHKRIFDKMDSVDVYVEKKRHRAKQLQNGSSPSSSVAKKPEPAVKRAIFAPAVAKSDEFAPTVFSVKDADFNFTKNAPIRFNATSKIPVIAKTTIDQPKKSRTDHRQMYKTRKVKSEVSKGKLQQYVKGVRTNRRFDLQMQMRGSSGAT